MTREFDRLIATAAPEVPDCGPDRRAARAVLRSKWLRSEARRRAWDSFGVPVAAGLALLFLVAGTFGDLGSDSTDITFIGDVRGDETLPGSAYREVEVGFGRGRSRTSTGIQDPQIRELEIQKVLGEGTVEGLTGIEIGGMIDWQLRYLHLVDGTPVSRRFGLNEETENHPLFKSFMKKHLFEVLEVVRSDEPQIMSTREIAGYRFRVEGWKVEFPDYGTIVWYEGLPIP